MTEPYCTCPPVADLVFAGLSGVELEAACAVHRAEASTDEPQDAAEAVAAGLGMTTDDGGHDEWQS